MKNAIHQCQAAAVRACAVICDPRVDGTNERSWLVASLVVSCALKGRRTLSITPAVNNLPVIAALTQEGFYFIYFSFVLYLALRMIRLVVFNRKRLVAARRFKTYQEIRLQPPPLLSLDSRTTVTSVSPPAPCGINVTKINFNTFFFFLLESLPPTSIPSNSNLFLQSKFMCPRIQFPSHPHKLEVQWLIGIHLALTVIHPSMNNATLNLKCLITAI